MVLRDLDLLSEFEWVRVGMSITTVPSRQFEPGVPPIERRIETLKKLCLAGMRTWVSLAPVIPGIMIVDFDKLFERLSEAGVSSVSFGVLRFTGYEESKAMFEAASGMSTAEALAGREEVVAKLRYLVRQHGMDPSEEMKWRPGPSDGDSLDVFL